MAGYATPEGIVYLETKTFKNFGAGRHTVLTWGAKPFLLLSCPVLLGAFFWQKLLAIGLILAYVRDRKRLRSFAARLRRLPARTTCLWPVAFGWRPRSAHSELTGVGFSAEAMTTSRRVTLFDIADALGISTGTVHRALHDHPEVNPMTRTRVLQMSKNMGYRPNMAARLLSQKKQFQVSVNTLQGTTSFWDEVRKGIEEEAQALGMQRADIQFRTFPRLGEGEEEAFEAAMAAKSDGIILFPSRPRSLRTWMRRASRSKIPVVCVSTDAPETSRLALVSVDTMASGSLAADLMGRFLNRSGRVAVTLSALGITEHAEKLTAFQRTLKSLHPEVSLLDPIEDHDLEAEAYDKCRRLLASHPDLAGIYVTTEASMPVVEAAKDARLLDRLTIIATDLFPALIEQIRSGKIAATIYQRPHTQGRLAFRVLQEFLVCGRCPAFRVTLAPHLILLGNLDFFLEKQASSRKNTKTASPDDTDSNFNYNSYD